MGGKKEKPFWRSGFEIILPCIMNLQIQIRPVIQPSPSDRFVVKLKAERADKVELDTKPHAEPPDRSGVVRYLRPHQHNREAGIHRRTTHLPAFISSTDSMIASAMNLSWSLVRP